MWRPINIQIHHANNTNFVSTGTVITYVLPFDAQLKQCASLFSAEIRLFHKSFDSELLRQIPDNMKVECTKKR